MSEDNKPWEEAGGFALPKRMPPRPEPTLPPLPPPTTKVPKVFSIWGTIYYGIIAIASIAIVFIGGIANWTPPWVLTGTAFLYVFVTAGLICMGRIEANRDAKFFIQALRKRSDENKRTMRKIN
jgi:membrane protein required for beta-lactamase induction